VTDPLKLHILLTEEVGEIAAELKRTWSANYDGFSKERLAEEIVDNFCLLAALADQFDIDIELAVREKFFEKDQGREWRTGSVREDGSRETARSQDADSTGTIETNGAVGVGRNESSRIEKAAEDG